MDQIKIENFAREHPGVAFPTFRTLSAQETERIRGLLAVKLNLPSHIPSLDLVCNLSEKAVTLPKVSAEERFNLSSLLKDLGIEARDKVLINWYRFDDVDEISLSDLSLYFDDVWYPAADAIEVFDETLKWIVSIDYSGHIGILK
ncbi:MAG TPA: hypothetical protein VE713_07180 [Pyrinomonadaceae bacterium]|jgi:hypothetical protein|nr:hypothetical protein [Pyrinomonadaceae bacterium]